MNGLSDDVIFSFLHFSDSKERKIVKSLSCVQLFATPWTIAYQAPLSMGFSRWDYWSVLPFPSSGDLPNPGVKPGSPALQADALPSEPPGKSPRQWKFQVSVTTRASKFLNYIKQLLSSWITSKFNIYINLRNTDTMAYHGSLLLCLLLARDLYDHMIECSGIEIQFQNSICKVQLPGIKYFILGQNFFLFYVRFSVVSNLQK